MDLCWYLGQLGLTFRSKLSHVLSGTSSVTSRGETKVKPFMFSALSQKTNNNLPIAVSYPSCFSPSAPCFICKAYWINLPWFIYEASAITISNLSHMLSEIVNPISKAFCADLFGSSIQHACESFKLHCFHVFSIIGVFSIMLIIWFTYKPPFLAILVTHCGLLELLIQERIAWLYGKMYLDLIKILVNPSTRYRSKKCNANLLGWFKKLELKQHLIHWENYIIIYKFPYIVFYIR